MEEEQAQDEGEAEAGDEYELSEVPTDDEVPTVQHETECAKHYLQKFCPDAGDNLYDHLSEVLSKILTERPKNAFALFDEYSKKLRNDKYRSPYDYLYEVYVPPPHFKDAKKLIKLFKVHIVDQPVDYENLEESEEHVVAPKPTLPNVLELLYYFEQTDVGLPRATMVLLNLSIRKLIADTNIEDVRFWGKILGKPKNYYVVEAKLSEAELTRRLEELEKARQALEGENEGDEGQGAEQLDTEKAALNAAMTTNLSEAEEYEAGSAEEEDLRFEFPPLPENTWKPLPEVQPERIGTGANAKVYFVCTSPGLDNWVELPTVTPQQIVIARQIIHLFTGNLETKIHTYPPFPGKEKNYLRAQIARISADTHVSPIGYFTLHGAHDEDEGEGEAEEEEGEEEGEEGGKDGELVTNRKYEPLPLADLIDPSMSNWCHHSPYILKQGSVVWKEPGKPDGTGEGDSLEEGEEEEVAEEEEEEVPEGTEEEPLDEAFVKEIGPPLLTPLSEDAATESLKPWTARQSSRIQPDTAVALIRSNLWPGAYAFAYDKKFANIYIGWGLKHNAYNYNPPAMPDIQDQYPLDSELVEIQDPSFEEEEAYRIAHLPPIPDDEEEEEEEEESDVSEP